jgi:hypothetical protein
MLGRIKEIKKRITTYFFIQKAALLKYELWIVIRS